MEIVNKINANGQNENVLVSINQNDVINGVLTIPRNVESLSSTLLEALKKLNVVEIKCENGCKLKSIAKEQFTGIMSLERVDFSNCEDLESIGLQAFKHCGNLKNANFNNCKKLINIYNGAFFMCYNLSEITLKGCENLENIASGAFSQCTDLSTFDFDSLPNLQVIYENAFNGCKNLKRLNFSKNLKLVSIGANAFCACFSLSEVDLSNLNIEQINECAFYDCTNLKKFKMQNCKNLTYFSNYVLHLTRLEEFDIRGCSNLKHFKNNWINTDVAYLDYNVQGFAVNAFKRTFPERTLVVVCDNDKVAFSFKNNDSNLSNLKVLSLGFLKYARQKKQSLNAETINVFCSKKEIDILLKNANTVYEIVDKITAENMEKYEINVLQLLRALGYFGFENYGNFDKQKSISANEKAMLETYKNLLAKDLLKHKVIKNIKGETNKDYINKLLQEKTNKIARSYSLEKLVALWVENNLIANEHKEKFLYELGRFDFRLNADINFASFLVANFDRIMQEKISLVDVKEDFNPAYCNSINGKIRLFAIYNDFENILSASNKKVVTRSNNQRFTLEDCEYASIYNNVGAGNEGLAEVCGNAHLKQEEFESLQLIFEEGKKNKYLQILDASKDNSPNDFSYEIIEKDNPLGLVLGNITNCCQSIGGAGESCVRVGATNPYSAFAVFRFKNKIIGQSWLWYDEKQKLIVLDNIEVPDIYYGIVNRERAKEVGECVQRLCDNLFKTMRSKGYDVQNVIIGSFATDMEFLDKNYYLETNKGEFFSCNLYLETSKVYSDIEKEGQYIVYKNGKPFKRKNKREISEIEREFD
ncbi:MAG: leucine-rich repeat domain-containing protein [Clostridia bacterium]|nr:leucine-rich repeat domain-containing protein [Clostridia bacterium]